MDIINQAQTLMSRPHVVIATPGRIKVLIEQSPDISAVFSKTKVIEPFYFFLFYYKRWENSISQLQQTRHKATIAFSSTNSPVKGTNE